MGMKEYLLGIFPGLEAEWKRDHGDTVLEEYFAIQKRQLELETLWKKMEGFQLESMPLAAEDLLVMQIRLMPDSGDPRPYYTQEEIRWLTSLYNAVISEGASSVRYADYEKFMKLVLARKPDNDRNSLLMKRRFLMAQLAKNELGGPGQQFEVEIETGEVLIAELICTIEMDDVEYALYFIPNEKHGLDIMASIVQQDDEGYDTLVDLTDPAINAKIREYLVSNFLTDPDQDITLSELLDGEGKDSRD